MDKYFFKQIDSALVVRRCCESWYEDAPVPSGVVELIDEYCSLFNGPEFYWEIGNLALSSKSHFTSGCFDVGLPNKFFVELELGKQCLGVSLDAYPFHLPITSALFHCEFDLLLFEQNKRLNSWKFSEILQFSHSTHPRTCIISVGDEADNAYGCMRYTWWVDDIKDMVTKGSPQNEEKEEKENGPKDAYTINVTKDTSFTILCRIKILKIYYTEDNGNTNKHSSNYDDYAIQDVIYNDLQYVQPLTHKFMCAAKDFKFEWKWKLSKKISTGFDHSKVYYDMFQLQCKQDNNDDKDKFGLLLCGLPPKTYHIGVQCECMAEFKTSEGGKMEQDIYLAHMMFDYGNSYHGFDEYANDMIEILRKQHGSITLVCNMTITQRYDRYGEQVSLLSDSKTGPSSSPSEDTVTTKKRNEQEEKPNTTDGETYIWNIDELATDSIKGYYHFERSSDVFRLNGGLWYLDINKETGSSECTISTGYCNYPTNSDGELVHFFTVRIVETGIQGTFFTKNNIRVKQDIIMIKDRNLKKLTIEFTISSRKLWVNKDCKEDYTDVETWLKNTVKLPQYLEQFKIHGLFDLETLKMVTKEDLEYMGITKMGHVLTLMKHIARLELKIEHE